MTHSRALVFGGTGTVGREVVRGLAAAGVPTVFTYHAQAEAAAALADAAPGSRAVALDLRDVSEIRTLLRALAERGEAPDVLIHCAAVASAVALTDITDEQWDDAIAINARSAFVACQELARHAAASPAGANGGFDIVLLGALDRAQTSPLPVTFAATQGTLATLTTAVAKEIGPLGGRINMIALGVLSAGLSADISPALLADYKTFSALRRVGEPAEAARVVLWLALENRYMNGKVLTANGGI